MILKIYCTVYYYRDAMTSLQSLQEQLERKHDKRAEEIHKGYCKDFSEMEEKIKALEEAKEEDSRNFAELEKKVEAGELTQRQLREKLAQATAEVKELRRGLVDAQDILAQPPSGKRDAEAQTEEEAKLEETKLEEEDDMEMTCAPVAVSTVVNGSCVPHGTGEASLPPPPPSSGLEADLRSLRAAHHSALVELAALKTARARAEEEVDKKGAHIRAALVAERQHTR